jgi:hypothetical protein
MKRILASIITAALILPIAACKTETSAEKAAQNKQVASQMSVKVKAVEAVPAPVIDNYQAREAVAKFMHRVNQKGQVWYVYKESRSTGEILKAYTSSIYPMSVCSFMTPTEEVKEVSTYGSGSNPISVTNAIALDGLYYKGGECPTFFFDLVTDALVVIDEDAVVSAYDQPLDVDVEVTTFRKDTLSKS